MRIFWISFLLCAPSSLTLAAAEQQLIPIIRQTQASPKPAYSEWKTYLRVADYGGVSYVSLVQVAELFNGFGYEVELTKRTRDGGKDVIAIRRKEVETRFLVECKRPDPGNPVGVSTVRELYGVKADDGASKAILATTTYLTPDAKLFIERHRWELEAREYDAIHEWISTYLGMPLPVSDA